jgi:hypothetical protein
VPACCLRSNRCCLAEPLASAAGRRAVSRGPFLGNGVALCEILDSTPTTVKTLPFVGARRLPLRPSHGRGRCEEQLLRHWCVGSEGLRALITEIWYPNTAQERLRNGSRNGRGTLEPVASASGRSHWYRTRIRGGWALVLECPRGRFPQGSTMRRARALRVHACTHARPCREAPWC